MECNLPVNLSMIPRATYTHTRDANMPSCTDFYRQSAAFNSHINNYRQSSLPPPLRMVKVEVQ